MKNKNAVKDSNDCLPSIGVHQRAQQTAGSQGHRLAQ